MANINTITITGHLGINPELRYTQNEKPYCKFSVANNTGYGDYENTTWFNVEVWTKQAESCGEYLMKGSHVAITGQMICNQVDDQYYWKLKAFDVVFLDKKGERTDLDEDDWDVPF